MNDHRPPLWGYDALAVALTSAFVVAFVLLVAEVVSICTQLVVPPLQRLLRWAGLEPPRWAEEALELADLTQEVVERLLYEVWDRFDPPLYSALRWLWRRLHMDWAVEVALLVLDICSVLPAEVWRLLTTGDADESQVQPTDQRCDHLPSGRCLDDDSRSGNRGEPNA